MLAGHKCVWRTKFMNLCNTSAVWRSECTTDIQSLCFPSPLLSVFSITLPIVHMHFMDYVHANQITGTLKILNHLRLPCGVFFPENLFDFLTTAKHLSSISCLYQCSPRLLHVWSTLFRDLKCPHGHVCMQAFLRKKNCWSRQKPESRRRGLWEGDPGFD